MLSDNIFYVVLIAIVGILALTANYVLTHKETQSVEKSKRLKWLKEQAEHTLNALAVLKEVGCREDIIEKLNQHAMTLIEEIGALAPDSDLMTEIVRNKESTDRVERRDGGLTSDRSVKRAQIYLNFAERLFVDLANKGRLTVHLAQAYQQELYWLNITIVTEAHINQAKRMVSINEPMSALSHYKHAKAILLRSTISGRQKKRYLDDIQAEIEKIQPRKDSGAGTLAESLDDYLR